jgi:NTP pyrophosphatase (non-canonical NTP hydrolase)
MRIIEKLMEKNRSFGRISEWAIKLGLPVRQSYRDIPQEEYDLCLALIDEELAELKQAVKDRDMSEIADALGDLDWVVKRMMQHMGITEQSYDRLNKEIHDSNMSKLCDSVEEAKVEAMRHENVSYDMVTPGVYRLIRLSDGKLMKPKGKFREPNFNFLIKQIVRNESND